MVTTGILIAAVVLLTIAALLLLTSDPPLDRDHTEHWGDDQHEQDLWDTTR
jgi:hypothetical protein